RPEAQAVQGLEPHRLQVDQVGADRAGGGGLPGLVSKARQLGWRVSGTGGARHPRSAGRLRPGPVPPVQHSTIFTARPPRAVSLYLVFMSAPVSRMVLMTESSDT